MRHLFSLLLLASFTCLLASSALAQWQPGGVLVCGGSLPKIASDGAGGAIVTSGGGSIQVQRMSPAGIPMWLLNGVMISATFHIADAPAIAPDGAGGAIVAWQDVSGGSSDIYAQRVDASGTLQWTSGGVVVCSDAAEQVLPKIASDGAGGAIIAWQDDRNGNADIFVRHVDASGAPQGIAGGYQVTVAAGDQVNMSMVSDGAGGAIIAWEDGRSGSGDIYAQRVNTGGISLWTANGLAVCTATNHQGNPTITSDGAGGAIVAWWDKRSDIGDIYAQRVNAGAVQWTANGVGVCTDPGEQGSPFYYSIPAITTDGAGGAIVAWGDIRGGIYSQRVNASGAGQWTPDGIAVSGGNAVNPVLVADGVGGAIFGWLITYDAGFDFFAQRVDAFGATYWADGGIPLSTPANNRDRLEIVTDGSQGAIAAWSDDHTGPQNVYASMINGNTSAGSSVAVIPRDVTTGGTPVTVTFDEVGNGSTSLVTTSTGPTLPGGFIAGDGTYYNIATTAQVSGNITVCVTYNPATLTIPEADVRLIHYDTVYGHWVGITTSLDTDLNQVCGVTTSLSPFAIGSGIVAGVGDEPGSGRLALHQNHPNPFGASTAISFDVPNAGTEVRIRIFDVSGQQVRSLVDHPFAAGAQHVSWDGRDDRGHSAGPGIYYYRLDAGSFRQTMKMVRVR